ncbi:NEL-type E3 ubiquitin ligase domain-containing protein [Acidovorax sp. NCPPB 4044]|uniref:NEL-type E3 ubiquitin ligase domain-containing protein n=1 Tax=Acidovorax sp. NCPPB 4044 TaxID=2940490 RepID=UPI0023041E2A|nr:NEL-type E3 ubiquitin ligase domain-containing protein [Acidovorax sp. NCPPB 4044]MDA8523172.1 NEL domain-containing protein [Acidovorax sp. NCPPB 4044]
MPAIQSGPPVSPILARPRDAQGAVPAPAAGRGSAPAAGTGLPPGNARAPVADATGRRSRVDSAWVRSALGDMARRSATLHDRWLKKPASEQYLYAKRLEPAQRARLEEALEQRFRQAADPRERKEAMTLWLSVQHARLRTHGDEHRSAHHRAQAGNIVHTLGAGLFSATTLAQRVADSRSDYYDSMLRPEYRTALNHLLRVIGDAALEPALRGAAEQALRYHCETEGTIAPAHANRLRRDGIAALAASGHQFTEETFLSRWEQSFAARHPGSMPGRAEPSLGDALRTVLADPSPARRVGAVKALLKHAAADAMAAAQAQVLAAMDTPEARDAALSVLAQARRLLREEADLDDDIAKARPLAEVAGEWMGTPELDVPELDMGAFGSETYASSFSRLLERRHPSALALADPAGRGRAILEEGREVIRAVCEDGTLRAQVFAMSANALGTCGDNVAAGFAAIVLAVRAHGMARAIREGRVDAAGLGDWARRQFRLGALETEVHLFIQRARQLQGLPEDMAGQLDRESMETLLHAQVALKQALDLPDSVPSEMAYAPESVLTPIDLATIAGHVLEAEADPGALEPFLLALDAWRDGVRLLHPEPFAKLEADFDEDPFHDRDLPRDGDAHVEERVAYNEAAADYVQRKREAEDALLRQYTGMPGG